MLVFWQQKLVFLATPKTGTTAIENALESLSPMAIQRPPALKHTSVTRYNRFVGPWLQAASGEPFETVALMREPRDWLASWYRYRRRADIEHATRQTQGLSFDDFVQAWCSDSPPPFADVGMQSKFLTARSGPVLDRLFRYEDIDRFVDFLEDRLHCEITLPRLNVSPAAETALSAATETMLRDRAVQDYALYARLGPDGKMLG
ncbi:hypothetical protein [Neogemmobacter tilapiae]|uniref:Gamma-glutamyl kinase n=1 Tax=Neogemmobacter tilapiae TaxID=875041 RepID=A0A918TER4_9RHOB|nr:hypothetical protein [Gemmobacter tilapiae]GHC45193.1 hypothetical protein GCM10007315_03190 [Gemmobacter tilapiae]